MSVEIPTTWERNRRVIAHEASTPFNGHDEGGRCCLRAALTPLPNETPEETP